MPNSVGFGIVGSGMIAKVHAEAIQSIPQAKLVAFFSRKIENAKSMANKYGAAAYDDYAEFLAHPDLQIVNICTPSGMHLENSLPVAKAGKHLLIEKPIEINLERADRIIDACRSSGVKLGVIFQSRFLESVQKIKSALDQKKLGKIFLADAYIKWYRAPEYYAENSWHGTALLDGGGALINQAIHTIDLLRWMLGPVATVAAMKAALRYPHIEGEDTLVGNLKFQNGALGVVVAATSVKPGFKRRLEISGEKGTIILDGDHISVWEIEGDESPTANGVQLTDGSSNPAAISTEGHRRQIEDMMKAVIEKREPVVDGPEGRNSLELVQALYQAAQEHREINLANDWY